MLCYFICYVMLCRYVMLCYVMLCYVMIRAEERLTRARVLTYFDCNQNLSRFKLERKKVSTNEGK